MKQTLLVTAFLFSSLTLSAQTFTLRSKDLSGQATNKQVLNGFGCKGENTSPELYWENAPEGTKSFGITVFDHSAPTESGWWHWLVFDIPPSTVELKPGAGDPALQLAPAGSIQSLTDFKTTGYGGPCPPAGSGIHKYEVTVYALKCDKLGLDGAANPALVNFMMQQQVIEKSSLVFYYKSN